MVVSIWVVFLILINYQYLIKHTGTIISFQNVTFLMTWLILHWQLIHTLISYMVFSYLSCGRDTKTSLSVNQCKAFG